MADRTLDGLKIPIKADASDFRKEIQSLVKEVRAQSQALKSQIEQGLKPYGKELDEVKKRTEELANRSQETSKKIGQIKGTMSAVGSTVAGLGAALGATNTKFGQMASVGANLIGVFASGGPLGLGLAAAGVAIGLIASAMGKAKAENDAFIDSSRKAGEVIKTTMQSAIQSTIGNVEELRKQLRLVGKDATTSMRMVAEMDLAQAKAQAESIERTERQRRAMAEGFRAQVGLAEGRVVDLSYGERKDFLNRAKAAEAEADELKKASVEAKILVEEKRKSLELTNKIAAAFEKEKRIKDGIASAAERRAKLEREIADTTRRMLGDLKKILDIETRGRNAAGVVSTTAGVAPGRDFGGAVLSARPSAPRDTSAEDAARQARIQGGVDKLMLADGIARGFLSMDLGTLGSSIGTAAGGPMAGQVAGVFGAWLSQMFQMFQQLGTALADVSTALLKGTKFEGGRKAGMGATGAGAGAIGVTAGTLIVGPFIMLLPIVAAIAALVPAVVFFGASLYDAAFETKSFERYTLVVNHAFDQLTRAMEPVFENFMSLAGGAFLVARAVGGIVQPIADFASAIGSTILWSAMHRLTIVAIEAGSRIARMGITTASISLTVAHFGSMVAMAGVQLAKTFGTADDMTAALTGYIESQLAVVQASQNVAEAQQGLADLLAAGETWGNMTEQDFRDLGNSLADTIQSTDTFSDRLDSVGSQLLNLPSWLNVGAARRNVTGPDQGGTSSQSIVPTQMISATINIGTVQPANGEAFMGQITEIVQQFNGGPSVFTGFYNGSADFG